VTPDPIAALETLIELRVTRILTSGGMPRVVDPDAMAQIARSIDAAAGRIEILPASGIRVDHAAELVQRTGCRQVHAACRSRYVDMDITALPHRQLGTLRAINGTSQDSYGRAAPTQIAALRRELDRLASSADLL
jgi:copper homeostasis protein